MQTLLITLLHFNLQFKDHHQEDMEKVIRDECLSLVPTNPIVPEMNTVSDSGNGPQRKQVYIEKKKTSL